jgi:hypothetical protein
MDWLQVAAGNSLAAVSFGQTFSPSLSMPDIRNAPQ